MNCVSDLGKTYMRSRAQFIPAYSMHLFLFDL